MRLIVALVTSLGLFAAPVQGADEDAATNGAPPAGAVLVGQFTVGGCVSVCETLAMCDDAYIDEKNGDCWLTLDKTHVDFVSLVKACPKPDGRRFNAEMSDGTWRLICASAATGEKAEPEDSAIEDLPNIEPF